jgi:hypothetical protein
MYTSQSPALGPFLYNGKRIGVDYNPYEPYQIDCACIRVVDGEKFLLWVSAGYNWRVWSFKDKAIVYSGTFQLPTSIIGVSSFNSDIRDASFNRSGTNAIGIIQVRTPSTSSVNSGSSILEFGSFKFGTIIARYDFSNIEAPVQTYSIYWAGVKTTLDNESYGTSGSPPPYPIPVGATWVLSSASNESSSYEASYSLPIAAGFKKDEERILWADYDISGSSYGDASGSASWVRGLGISGVADVVTNSIDVTSSNYAASLSCSFRINESQLASASHTSNGTTATSRTKTSASGTTSGSSESGDYSEFERIFFFTIDFTNDVYGYIVESVATSSTYSGAYDYVSGDSSNAVASTSVTLKTVVVAGSTSTELTSETHSSQSTTTLANGETTTVTSGDALADFVGSIGESSDPIIDYFAAEFSTLSTTITGTTSTPTQPISDAISAAFGSVGGTGTVPAISGGSSSSSTSTQMSGCYGYFNAVYPSYGGVLGVTKTLRYTVSGDSPYLGGTTLTSVLTPVWNGSTYTNKSFHCWTDNETSISDVIALGSDFRILQIGLV